MKSATLTDDEIRVLKMLSADTFRVSTLSSDGTPADLMACRSLSNTGLVEWKIGSGYAITSEGRAVLAAAK